jgi:hypothetical protein
VTSGLRHQVIDPRRLILLAATALTGLVLVITGAHSAMAHPATVFAPTNYQTRITAITPAVPGLTMRVIGHGDQLELTNSSGRDLVVLGYAGEPYLRVGRLGVFANQRSPATYLNRDRFPTVQLPGQADPKATPVWQRISRDHTAAWHDHRAHWMGSSDPPAVQATPWQVHVINPQWRVELRDGPRSITIIGDLRWVPTPQPATDPSPRPWPWIIGAGAGALGITAGIRHQRTRSR